MLPCWIVDVRHKRMSGRLGHFRSRPLTWTHARRVLAHYKATGHWAQILCLEQLVDLHKRIISGDLTEDVAREIAKHDLGYDVSPSPA